MPRERRRAAGRRSTAQDRGRTSQPLENVTTARSHRRSCILVVEDDPALVSFYKSGLTLAGFEVATASDGVEALNWIEHTAPDLIVLDLGLPRLSGFDVRREVAAHARTRDIPILVVTGESNVDPEGFDCVLQKPVDADSLVAVVEDCLRRRRG